MTTINVVEKRQIVSVFTSVEFAEMLLERPLSNVVLRNKNKDELILLERVALHVENGKPTVEEFKNAWKSMFYNTWTIKFEIEKLAHKDLKCGNIFRNLDKFDVLMFDAGELVFDTATYNLTLVEGRIGITPKSKTREDFPTNKMLKAHAYLIAESAWSMLNIETHVLKQLQEADKVEVSNEAEKKEEKPTSKGKGKKVDKAKKVDKTKKVKVEPEATEEPATEEPVKAEEKLAEVA